MCVCIKKGKGFPYSIPSAGPGADPGVQAVSLRVTVSHPPGGRLPLLSVRPAVTSRSSFGCLMTEAHRCEQLPKVLTQRCPKWDLNPQPIDRKSNTLPVMPPHHCVSVC